MGEKGNAPAEALSMADRTADAAGKVGDTALGVAAGTATGVASARLEKRLDGDGEGAATEEPPATS